jgi:predicted oxidoreductase
VEENFGGLAKESFGGMWFADTPLQRKNKIQDSVDLGLADWLAFGELGPADHWPRAWAEAYVNRSVPEVFEWLRERGVQFMPAPLWVERGLYVPGNSVPRWHVVWGAGHELATVMVQALLSHPSVELLSLKFGHKVESLLGDKGGIQGVEGLQEQYSEPFQAQAESVVLAAGGINGDIDRVRRNWHADWSTPPARLLNGSHKFAVGTLHDAAEAKGANITHLDWQWNYAAGVPHWKPRKPGHGLSLVPPKSALWLNWRGERIGPMPLVTGFDTHDLVAQVCKQERAYSWQVLNKRIALKELAISGSEFNPAWRDKKRLQVAKDLLFGNRWLYRQMESHCPDFIVADTLPELVDGMNALQGDNAVELDLVADAIGRYDAILARGSRWHNDEQARRIEFTRRYLPDRLRTCKAQQILDPRAGPLIAIREHIISRKSMGGIQTDLECRVLDTDGQPIPGLFSVGETAGFGGGGMNGKRGLEGTFLGGCVFSGRIAGQKA